MSTNPKAIDWHRRPKGISGPCAVCGAPNSVNGEHRATPDGELAAAWLRRVKSPTGWKVFPVFPAEDTGPAARPDSKHKPLKPKIRETATKATCEVLGKAAALFAAGKPWAEIVKALGYSEDNVYALRKRHPDLWQVALDKAMERQRLVVEAMAGTETMLENTETYLIVAKRVDGWATSKGGKPLFAPDGQMTLTTFFAEWYLPNRLFEASPTTKEKYVVVLRRWRLLTGDPPVEKITATTLAVFRDALLKLPGLKTTRRQSPNSVRTTLRHVQVLLDKLGPPGPRRRDCLGILARPPWVKPPREFLRTPKTVTLDRIGELYLGATAMDFPQVPGIKPPQWWRSLLAVTYCTGLRARSLFALQWEWIDWPGCRIVVPTEAMKSRRPIIIFLNPTAIEHLQAIRTGETGPIFPWPLKRRESFYTWLHKLEDAAGIPRNEHFGLHTLRRSMATALAGDSLSAAQLALGHTADTVTKDFYINNAAIISQALGRLPMPSAFHKPR